MGLSLVTAPTAEPVTLDEAKAQLRIVHTAEDVYLLGLIPVAREAAEEYAHRAFLTQTWALALDRFPCAGHEFIELTRGPVQRVERITYVAADGTQTTWAAENYVLDNTRETARVGLAYGATWPIPRWQPNAVTVTYVAGYGDTQSKVPARYQQAILLKISDLYGNREGGGVGIERAWDALLNRTPVV